MEIVKQDNYLERMTQHSGNTSFEISSQPAVWRSTWNTLQKQQKELSSFLNYVYAKDNLNIILTGAGSSAFIGVALQGPFQKYTNILTRAISTTDLVTHPELFLLKDKPTLLVSFARSGDSPESLAAVNLVNELCTQVYHLIITCNANGKLAQGENQSNKMVFFLPPETNDKGLAMTASFTSMLLSGLVISRIHQTDRLESQISTLISYGENILQNYTERLYDIAKLDFKRVAFLGSGPLAGTAQESHLKLQELTNGNIICKHDSFLGFRHGPKAVTDKSTLVVYLFSNNKYAEQYENDLVSEICKQELSMYKIGIMESPKDTDFTLDLEIILGTGNHKLDEEFLTVCSVLPAQILGYYKSLNLGLNPDNPSASGVISRVVQGVKIYAY